MLVYTQKKMHDNPCRYAVILLPLRPASLTHKNPQGRKIIPVGRKE